MAASSRVMGRAGVGRRRRWAADAEAAWRVRGAVATARDGSTVKAPMGPTSDARQHMISLVGIDFIVEQKYDVCGCCALGAGGGAGGVVGCDYAGPEKLHVSKERLPPSNLGLHKPHLFLLLFCGLIKPRYALFSQLPRAILLDLRIEVTVCPLVHFSCSSFR